MTRIMPKLSVVVVALSLSASTLTPTAAASSSHQAARVHHHRPLRDSPLIRRIEAIDSPTHAPHHPQAPAPAPKPHPKPHPKPANNDGGGDSTRKYSGGGDYQNAATTTSGGGGSSASSGGGSSTSSGGGGSTSAGGGGGGGSTPITSGGSTTGGVTGGGGTSNPIVTSSSSNLHGSSKSILTLLSSAIGLGFIVAGVAFVRQRESLPKQQNDDNANHRLKGSVKARMSTFSHLVDMSAAQSRSGDGGGTRLGKKRGLLSPENRKKLVRQLSRGKSVRQQSVESDMGGDVYTRATDNDGPILVV